ncbi:MAG TPA: glycoside hydrolase family 97 protein [Bacteroidales bacterium]|nr:glycoside hydrolase family 97 protein [Bacteroidales bacterium]
MRRTFFLFLMLLTFGWLSAAKVVSPDGKLVFEIKVNQGEVLYEVLYEGETFVAPSALGLATSLGDFRKDLMLAKQSAVSLIEEHYALRTIKSSSVHYRAHEVIFSFNQDERHVFDLEVQVSNNDIAFRYKVYPQGETLVTRVFEEETTYVFPEGTSTFLSPQMEPMTAFARTAPSYETPYFPDGPVGKNGWGNGYVFPALFRIGDAGWVLISETGVDSRYAASRLLGKDDGSYKIGHPMEAENNGNGTVAPGIALPGYTPWRTLTVGTTLQPIVETTIPFDVVEEKYPASENYAFGKGSWSWIIKMDGHTTYETQKEYIDFSAAMGYSYVLVDALWDTQIGRDRIEELAAYAASKDVALFLWYNSNGYWNDAPQGPHGYMHQSSVRRPEMEWMQGIGVKGIKVDFFGGDKQVTMDVYESLLYDANDYGLMVIFHGTTLPRGWERMFPNFASSEAVLASEMLHFSQERCDEEAVQASMHPFIRNTVASMDFGGSALNQYYNANNTPGVGTQRKTSDVFALATAVLFQSPVQFFALAPNNMHDAPAWAIDFMKEVPSLWDEVRFIDGYPGRYAVLARRSGDQWYVAGINAGEETLQLELDPDLFVGAERLRLYSDDSGLKGSLKVQKMKPGSSLKVSVPKNGGFVLTQ